MLRPSRRVISGTGDLPTEVPFPSICERSKAMIAAAKEESLSSILGFNLSPPEASGEAQVELGTRWGACPRVAGDRRFLAALALHRCPPCDWPAGEAGEAVPYTHTGIAVPSVISELPRERAVALFIAVAAVVPTAGEQ